MNKYIVEVNWIKETVKRKILDISLVAETDYSLVLKIICEKETLYFKKNTPSFNYEDKILNYLFKNNLNAVSILDSNNELNCFIVSDNGISVKDKIESLSCEIIDKFINIQCSVNINDLKSIGLREFSNKQIVSLCEKYNLESKPMLNLWTQLNNEINPSIEHGDFHLGNILVGENQNISFIDLAEATITNPLMALLCFENTLKWRGGLNDSKIEIFKSYWLMKYSEKSNLNISKLNKYYDLAKVIYPLYTIYGLDLLLSVCIDENYKEKTKYKITKQLSLIKHDIQ